MRGIPGQDGVDDLALDDIELGPVRHVVGAEPGAADDDGIRSGDGEDGVPVLARRVVLWALADPRNRVGVVEPDAEHLLHAHGAADAAHPSHQIGPPVAVRHEVDDLDLAGLGLPARHQHEGVGLVLARRAALGADGGEPPMTVLLVAEQGAERRRRVEPRQAQPVDAAVRADERAGVTVADERVVLDRQGHGAATVRPEGTTRSGCRSNHSATYQQVAAHRTATALLDVVDRERHQLVGVPATPEAGDRDRVIEDEAVPVIQVLGDTHQLAVDVHRVPVRVGLVGELGRHAIRLRRGACQRVPADART